MYLGQSEKLVERILNKVAEENKPTPTPEPEPTPEPTPELAKVRKNPVVTEKLPFAFRADRKLYPYEIEYAKEIFGDSIRYDKVRITRDHWFAYGSTHVIGNTIHFTSDYGGEFLFEDTPEWGLSQAGLDLLGHEISHVWQFQHGGWAYVGDALTKQAAGFYSTGSRNTAYDYKTAIYWELPWEEWGPEQQAQCIDDWNLAKRGRTGGSAAAVAGGPELVEELQPYIEKARRGEGVTQLSLAGTAIICFIMGGIGYLIKQKKGVYAGITLGILVNLPWNAWYLEKPGLA